MYVQLQRGLPSLRDYISVDVCQVWDSSCWLGIEGVMWRIHSQGYPAPRQLCTINKSLLNSILTRANHHLYSKYMCVLYQFLVSQPRS